MSAAVAFTAVMIAREFILNRKSGNARLNVVIAVLNLSFGILFILRATYILTEPGYVFLTNNIVDMAFFTLLPLFEVSWNVCFFIINSHRTYAELEKTVHDKILLDDVAIAAYADYREIFNSSNDAIFVYGTVTGDLLDINAKATQMYGYTLAELKEIVDFSSGEPGYTHDDALNMIKKAIDGEPQIFEWKSRNKNGDVFWVEINLKRVQIGSSDRIVAIIRDIEERKRAEEQRRANDEKMQQVQRLESLGVMAGGIAHDFNNLLMIIQGNIDMAHMSVSHESRPGKFLNAAAKACVSAAELTKQMLAYAGKGRMLIQSVNVNDLIDEIKSILEANLTKNININCSLDKGIPKIAADSSQIKQLIINLVINASEAIGDAPGKISIKTGVHVFDDALMDDDSILMSDNMEPGSFIFIEVSDTGSGIDKAALSKIFEPFFSTKITGRGLGLAAVMGIIRNMGGAIRVISEKGKGTVFTLYLPSVERSPGAI